MLYDKSATKRSEWSPSYRQHAPSGRSIDLFIALTTGRLDLSRSRRRKLPTVAEQYRPAAGGGLLPAEVTSPVSV